MRLTRYDVGGTSISAKATIDELTRRPLLLNYFRFRVPDMAGLAAGSTQSRLNPKRTVDPSAILTARAGVVLDPICLHSQTGAGLFAPDPMAETKGLRCVEALLLYQTCPAVREQNMPIRKNNVS